MKISGSKKHIVLVSTSSAGHCGSMNRYLRLVQDALQTLPADQPLKVSVCHLASEGEWLTKLPSPLRTWSDHLWIACHARQKVRQLKPDLCHIMDGSCAYVIHRLKEIRCVVTAHDFIPLLHLQNELKGKKPSLPAQWLIKQSLQGLLKAKQVAAVSQHTQNDLMRLGQLATGKISVIHNALAPQFIQRSEGNSTAKVNSTPRIMHLGHNGDYKNRAGVLQVAAHILAQQPVHISMVGPPPSADLLALTATNGLDQVVSWDRADSDTDLIAFYKSADLLLFPSLYEGFGWPPLEAMACDCPVVCSNAASLPEVVGNAACMAAPDDYETLARHCLEILNNPRQRQAMVEAGRENIQRFTPEIMGKNLYQLYSNTLLQCEL